MDRDAEFYRSAERRIELLTLAIGAALAAAAAWGYGWRAALGVAVGAVLSWLNFRLLKQGIGTALEAFARQIAESQRAVGNEPPPPVRLPKRLFFRVLGGFILLLLALYVILSGSILPGVAVMAGLFALVAAVMVELLYQLVWIT